MRAALRPQTQPTPVIGRYDNCRSVHPMTGDRMRTLRLIHSSAWFEPSTAPTTEIANDIPLVDATVQAVLARGRTIVPLPPVVRARAIARARAAIATLAEPTT